MNWRAAAWSFCAGSAAVLVALAAWRTGTMVVDAFGLDPVRPLVPVVAVFLALTALQAAWDRAETALRPTSRRGQS